MFKQIIYAGVFTVMLAICGCGSPYPIKKDDVLGGKQITITCSKPSQPTIVGIKDKFKKDVENALTRFIDTRGRDNFAQSLDNYANKIYPTNRSEKDLLEISSAFKLALEKHLTRNRDDIVKEDIFMAPRFTKYTMSDFESRKTDDNTLLDSYILYVSSTIKYPVLQEFMTFTSLAVISFNFNIETQPEGVKINVGKVGYLINSTQVTEQTRIRAGGVPGTSTEWGSDYLAKTHEYPSKLKAMVIDDSALIKAIGSVDISGIYTTETEKYSNDVTKAIQEFHQGKW